MLFIKSATGEALLASLAEDRKKEYAAQRKAWIRSNAAILEHERKWEEKHGKRHKEKQTCGVKRSTSPAVNNP